MTLWVRRFCALILTCAAVSVPAEGKRLNLPSPF
jgi:hypothetical protein